METIQKFIDEVVKEYNSGRLTPNILSSTFYDYMNMFDYGHENNKENLRNARSALYKAFVDQKGEKKRFQMVRI